MVLNDLKLWPEKLATGVELAEHFFCKQEYLFKDSHFKEIVFVGMGGSGIAGKIAKTLINKSTSLKVSIIDSPIVPNFIDKNSLAFVVSYSGNTWETVEAMNSLIKKNIPIVVLTNGGIIKEIAEKNSFPIVSIPESISPRAALGYFLGFIFGFLDKLGIFSGKDIINEFITHSIEYIPKFCVESFFDSFLRLITGNDFFHVWGVNSESEAFAFRAQTQFNENSKIQAVYSTFPELCHNLIVGFTKSAVSPIVLFCYTDFVDEKLKKAIQAIEELMAEKGVKLYKIPIFGNTASHQLFNIILWSDFASYFLGVQREVDINPVEIIDCLKEKHKQAGL